jgi:RHS repeat-associated protein
MSYATSTGDFVQGDPIGYADDIQAGTRAFPRRLFELAAYHAGAYAYSSRNRWYSPTLEVWTQQDPAGYVDGSSLYQFTLSNPVRLTDPRGLDSLDAPFPGLGYPPIFPISVEPVILGDQSFFDYYVLRGRWGFTDRDDLGQMSTILRPLQLPQPLPKCLQDKGPLLQNLIDSINFTAELHELEAQRWIQQNPDSSRGDPEWTERFQNSTSEHMDMYNMLFQLRYLVEQCKCDDNISKSITTIQNRLRYFYLQLTTVDGILVLQDPDARFKR